MSSAESTSVAIQSPPDPHAVPATTVEFAALARRLGREARRRGLVAPSYRCPPRLVGVDRSIRRRPGGGVVAVRLRARPLVAVQADMIEGVVAVNSLASPHADRVRAELWAVVTCTPGAAGAAPSEGGARAA